MLKKFAVAAAATAPLSTAAFPLTPAEAPAGNRAGAVAAGATIGLAAGAIIASQVQPRYHAPVRCRNQAVRRWNPYQRRYVVVGYRQVCY